MVRPASDWLRRALPAVVRAGLVSIAVILGLVTMHVLDLHAPEMSSSPAIAVGHAGEVAPTVKVGAAERHATPPGQAATGADSAASHAAEQPPIGGDCPACSSGVWEVALGCAIALMIVLTALLPPLLWRGVVPVPHWRPSHLPPRRVVSAAPSLHSLCILRT